MLTEKEEETEEMLGLVMKEEEETEEMLLNLKVDEHEIIKLHSDAYPEEILNLQKERERELLEKGRKSREEIKEHLPSPLNTQKKSIPPLELKVTSQVHEKLKKAKFNIENHNKEIKIREFRPSDLEEIKKLQTEWFPVRYDNEFYEKILKKKVYCFVAETEITYYSGCKEHDQEEHNQEEHDQEEHNHKQDQHNPHPHTEQIIIGAIIFNQTSSEGYLEESLLSICYNIFAHRQDALYIMTIGVIDEFRKMGVGKLFIKNLLLLAEQNEHIKLVFLHVIDYNKAAIRFYQKLEFVEMECLNGYYHILDKEYDGLAYGKLCNEGKLGSGWFHVIKRYFWK